MTGTILLIHGACLTPASLENFRHRYEAEGRTVLAPVWPGMDRPVEALRRDPKAIADLSLGRIADHYAAIIAELAEPPFLIGHSYGGLIVQMLLDRGLGAAGVAIDPAPAAGILAGPRAFRAALPIFLTWAGWRTAVTMSFAGFARDFGNRLEAAARRRIFDDLIVPAPGRLWYRRSSASVQRSTGGARPARRSC
jgi:pimeloyl-ACP methyl ester carboxylesterase